MRKGPTPLILLIHSLFEANPSIKAIRKVASLGALEITTQNNGIEGIQLIRDDIGKGAAGAGRPFGNPAYQGRP
jgi:hypothetical protein